MIELVVIAVVLLALFGLFGFGLLGKIGHDQKKAEDSSETALNKLFDGSPDVTFSGHMRSMKYETVIAGAKKRGYKLAHQAGDPKQAFTLMFEKV